MSSVPSNHLFYSATSVSIPISQGLVNASLTCSFFCCFLCTWIHSSLFSMTRCSIRSRVNSSGSSGSITIGIYRSISSSWTLQTHLKATTEHFFSIARIMWHSALSLITLLFSSKQDLLIFSSSRLSEKGFRLLGTFIPLQLNKTPRE